MENNEFLEQLKCRIKDARSVKNMSDWVCKNTINLKTNKGFSLQNYSFQKDIINDFHPNMCVKKLSQVGLSEVSYRKSMGFLAQNPGTSLLYTYPDLLMKKTQVQTRIRPLFDASFPMVKGSGEIRNNDLLQLGNSFMYVSANSESAATSSSIDMIVNDEYDLSNQEFISLVSSRVQASKFKIKQGFSTPTFAGYGISLEYESSDQREYWYKCPHCNHWQIPLYDLKNIHFPDLPEGVDDLRTDIDYDMALMMDLDSAYVCCEKCRKKLALYDETNREWVAKYPERLHSRGYWVRPFSLPMLSIKYLVTELGKYKKKDQLRRGVNTVLGEEYKDAEARLERDVIMKCFESQTVPDIPKEKPVFLGLDFGTSCHLTLVDENDNVMLALVEHRDKIVEKVKALDKKYNIVCGGMDRYPFTTTANELRDYSNGRFIPIAYSQGKDILLKNLINGDLDYCDVNRTTALDYVLNGVNKGSIKIYGYGNLKSVIIEHLRDMYRDDPKDGGQPIWKKMNGNDHFFHSLGYAFASKKVRETIDWSNSAPDNRMMIGIVGTEIDKKSLYNAPILSYSGNINRAGGEIYGNSR